MNQNNNMWPGVIALAMICLTIITVVWMLTR